MKKMNFLLPILLIYTSINAGTNIKHTLLMPRPIIDNLPISITGRHNPAKFLKLYNDHCHLQTTLFTKHSIKGEDVGKYFGVNGTNNININTGPNAAAVIASSDIDIWNRFLIHDHDQAVAKNDNLHANFDLNPKQEVYGFRIDFFGLLNNPIPRTFFKISAPITYIKNNLNSKYNTDVATTTGDKLSAFFNGQAINSNDNSNKQDALTNATISNDKRIVAGIADIDVHFGYRLVEDKTRHVYISGLVTIPTGNRPKSNYLFEPIYGNGNHFGIGWQLDGEFRMWKKQKHKGFLQFALTHKYTMDGTEKRVIPLNLPNYPFAHYYLTQKVKTAANTNGTALFPAANVLTQDVTIRPGNSVEGLLGLKFATKKFIINTGYNLFFKEKENMSLKTAWVNDVYAIAKETYNTTLIFNDTAELVRINNDILDLSGALTPNQLSHKLFASLGYNFNIYRHPAHIGIGAAYEFAGNNYELEGYEFWIKTSCAF